MNKKLLEIRYSKIFDWIGVDGLRLIAIVIVAALMSIIGLSLERLDSNIFWLYIYTLGLIGVIFFALLYILGRYEKRLWPSTELLTSQAQVEAALTDACNSAQEFIVVMGARARGIYYLKALTEAVNTRNIEYYRVVPGSKIDHTVHTHLEAILPNLYSHIGQDPKSRETTFASESVVIVTFASPEETNTFWATKTENPKLARDYKEFVLKTFMDMPTDNKISEESQLRDLCADCSSEEH